ncbi:MAG TPA: hypothetical protein P5136_00145 [Methanofastidiosum sp.]|nr:hypothetical protein [Methanofastidiosum sp.]
MKDLSCECEDYKIQIPKLETLTTFHGLRNNTDRKILKDWKSFTFCPWCGKKLK